MNMMQAINNGHQEKVFTLESELAEAEKLLAKKDQIVVILKEQQKSSRSGFQDLQKTNKKLVSKIEELEALVSEFDEERGCLNNVVQQHSSSVQKF